MRQILQFYERKIDFCFDFRLYCYGQHSTPVYRCKYVLYISISIPLKPITKPYLQSTPSNSMGIKGSQRGVDGESIGTGDFKRTGDRTKCADHSSIGGKYCKIMSGKSIFSTISAYTAVVSTLHQYIGWNKHSISVYRCKYILYTSISVEIMTRRSASVARR